MSYRPQIKQADGTMQDLPLDAETVKGKTIGQIATKDTITDAEVATNANIAQSKVRGLTTDYVASMSVSGRTVTYKNKNGVNMGSITTQDTTYGLASQSSNGLMSSSDKTKLDEIQSGAQKNTVLGVKGGSESAYRTGNVNITKANIGLGNVDNTSDEDKPVSTATQTALNGKANTSGTYPNLTVGKATNADKATNATNATNATKATQDASGNVITSTYATKSELSSGLSGKANTSGSYPNLTVGKATNADNAANATKADAIKQTDTRSTNELPSFYYNKAAAGQNFTFEFKESAAIGLTGQSTYCQLQTYAKWTDSTGGNITQVAVVDTNYFIRTSTGSTGWGAWQRLLKEGELGTVENATNATNIIPDGNGAVNPLGRKDGGTVGVKSTALGSNSTASGDSSTALGYTAVASDMRCTAIGNGATASKTDSTAVGTGARAVGTFSTAMGRGSRAIGISSTALGTTSLGAGIGTRAVAENSTALGCDAYVEGENSTALGFKANVSSTDARTMQLGGTTLSVLRCKVNLTVTSDKRDKTDIEGITDALAFVERLNPVTFVSNERVDYISDEDKNSETFRKYGMCEYDRVSHAAGTKKGERRRCGLLAQEVVEAMQSVYGTDNYANVVNDNFHDLTDKPSDVENKYTLAYANLVPFLIGAIKELNEKIKTLESKLATSSGAQEN